MEQRQTQGDNQQETVKEVDLAWLGGIIDGEGCIGIHRMMSHRTNATLSPRLIIGNTNADLVSHVCEILDSIPIAGYLKVIRKGKGIEKDCWILQVSRMDQIKKLLEFVRPYLYAKRSQLDLVLRFINIREKVRSQPRGKELKGWAYTSEELSIHKEMGELNSRGKTGSSTTLRQLPEKVVIKSELHGEHEEVTRNVSSPPNTVE